jgi:hypothetical protein
MELKVGAQRPELEVGAQRQDVGGRMPQMCMTA